MIALFLDTRSGGFTDDSTLSDMADPGRRVASKLTRDVQDNYPIAADFVLEFGNGFTNLFELKTGSLTFSGPTNSGTGGNGAAGAREVSIPLSTLGLTSGASVNFFAALISDTQFTSSEGIPSQGFNANPGFGSSPVTWSNFHAFVTSVPEVSPALAIPVAAVFAGVAVGIRGCVRRWYAAR